MAFSVIVLDLLWADIGAFRQKFFVGGLSYLGPLLVGC